MVLQIPRAPIAERFREVRTLLSHIKAGESAAIPPVDTEEVKILRGLFYVHLYGVLEHSLSGAIQSFLQAVSDLELKYWDLSLRFLPTAMNAHFKGLSDIQSQKKWQKRLDFVGAIHDGHECRIENSIFSPHLQSSEIEVIAEIVSYLEINSDVIKNSPDRHYVNEVTQKRHQIAHGRTSPSSVGASGRSADLERRLEAIRSFVDLFVELLEKHFNSYEFLNITAKARFVSGEQGRVFDVT